MNNLKRSFYVLIPIIIAITHSSCKNTSSDVDQPPPTEYAAPKVEPLKFSKPQKIDWDAIKAVKVTPVVTKLNWDKLPETSYDTAGFKPFKKPVEETKFDYNSLPEKDLDIDKLPSHPLKFKTYILPPPKLINGAKLQFKNGNLFSLYFGEDQKTDGVDIRCLFHDRDGFLWIASTLGIYRYDGESLELFIPLDRDEIFGIVQDGQGNIWSSDYGGGIGVLNPKTGILKISGPGQGLGSTFLTRLTEDMQHRIWATSWSGGVDIIDPNTQTVKRLDKAHGLSLKIGSFSSTMDKNGNIWISDAEGGVNIIDVKNKKIKYLDKSNRLKTAADATVFCDDTGRIWIGLQNGFVSVIDLQNNSIQTFSELKSPNPKFTLSDLFQSDKGQLWVANYKNGAAIIDPEKHTSMRLNTSNGLISNDITAIKKDSSGHVWIASSKGLNMISDGKALIERIGNDSINNLMEDNQGLIWKSGYHGVDILDRKNGTAKHLGIKEGLANDNTHLIKEAGGDFFIPTDSSVDVLDTVRNTIVHLRSNKPEFITDNSGLIWYLDFSRKGINVYDFKNQTIKHLGKTELQHDGSILSICMDRQGRIWIGTFKGDVEVIDPKTGTVRFLYNIAGLLSKVQIYFLSDEKGNIWIYTDTGIFIVDLKNQKFISYSRPQGLMEDKVLSLLEHNGQIYAGTNHGITVITPPVEGVSANKKWQSASYGLTKTWINNYIADVITKDGLYWSGDVGISLLDLPKKDTHKSIPYINGISVFDHQVQFIDQARFNSSMSDTAWPWPINGEVHYLKGQTPFNKSYVIQNGLSWDSVSGPGNMPINLTAPYNQNFIQFHYSSFNFTPHDTATYRYILNGVDKEWRGATSESSTVNYMNLQPGKYTFEVISRNADNVWSEPAKFSFSITPPWWQTWWAYVLYALLFAGIIWGFVTLRSRKLRRENLLLEQKISLRTKQLTEANKELNEKQEEIVQQKEEIESQRDDLEKTLTDLKATQTQLIQSEKMASLGELTAGIAHEIQNPLNFVNNFSEVNKELMEELREELDKGDTDEAKVISLNVIQNLEKITHHGKRADAIVKGMLEHSRSRSGKKERTDLNAMADEFMRLSYHGLRSKDKAFNSELITHFDRDLPKIEVIQQDIGRVLLNLFNNAFYAVSQKQKTAGADYEPEVTVTTSVENGRVIIRVKDNGVGIPDAIKEKIMQPFFTTKPTGEGTGLGLSLTYDMIVKGHGGSINVNSTEGEGAEFIIQL